MRTETRIRTVGLVLALVAMLAPALLARTSEPVAAQASGEVALWTEFTAGGEKTGIERLIEDWNAQGNGITISHRPIGNEQFFTVIRTALAGGQPPDLLQYEGYQQTRDFAGAGHLTDLTEWWTANSENFVLPEAGARACTFEGKIYCVPFTYQTGWQIYYNPEILEANRIEVPQTYEEFLAAAETLKAAGVTPISLGAKDGWPSTHWYMAFLVQRCGVETVYQAIERNGASFTDECFVQAATDLQSLAQAGHFSPGMVSDDFGTAEALFLAGRAAFFQTGSWFASGWEETPPKFEVGIMPFPRLTDAVNTEDITGAVTHVLAIPSAAANPEAAMDVLEWMSSEEAANTWAANGNISMYEGAVEASAPQVIKDLWATVQEAERALPWIENELPPGVGEDKVYTGTVALLSGSLTPEAFSQAIQDALEASAE